jgi:hypothetical protein
VTQAARAAARYDALLAQMDVRALAEHLAMGQERGHMTYKGRSICQVLRPFFVDRRDVELLHERAWHVTAAVHRAADELEARPDLVDKLGFTADEKKLIAIKGGFSPHDLLGRLDSFLQPDGSPRFLEYNGESPGGVAFGDALGDLFDDTPAMRELRAEFPMQRYATMPVVAGAFRSEYEAWAERHGRPRLPHPRVAILDIPGVATVGEFHLFARVFEAQGMPCRVVTTDDVRLEGGRLRAGDFEIDIVYRRLVTQDLLAVLDTEHVIVQAMRQNVAFIANGFEGYRCSNKGIFALLSDPALRPAGLAPATIAAIDAAIPWTRLAGDGTTSPPGEPAGKPEPLRDIAMRLKDRLVLKPTAGYGGQSVVLGWTRTAPEWRAAWQAAEATPTVVQERVHIPSQAFPVSRDGRLESAVLQYDVDPYVLQGAKVYGLGVRLSAGELLNVAAGAGSAVPAYVCG